MSRARLNMDIPDDLLERADRDTERRRLTDSETILRTPTIFRKPLPERTGKRTYFVDAIFDRSPHLKPEEALGFGCVASRYSSAAGTPNCADDCSLCREQYIPLSWQILPELQYADQHSNEAAQTLLDGLMKQTTSDLMYVAQQISAHGDSFVKRWQKRNPAKRANLLKQAMPEMKVKKWFEAEVDNNRAATVHNTSESASTRTAYLLPFLNVEILSEDPVSLLTLLFVRTRFSAAEWIRQDMHSHDLAFMNGLLAVEYNPHCVILEADGLGKLVPWQREDSHQSRMVGFPRALLAFRAQSKLATFIRSMVDMLLADKVASELPEARDDFDNLLFKLALQTNATTGGMHYQRAYSVPQCFSRNAILEILKLRWNIARDELWLQQTQPLYLRERLAQARCTTYHDKLPENERLGYLTESILSTTRQVDVKSWMFGVIGHLLHWSRKSSEVGAEDGVEGDDTALELAYAILYAHSRSQADDLSDLSSRVKAFQHFFTSSEAMVKFALPRPEEMLRKEPLYHNVLSLSCCNFRTNTPGFHLSYIHDLLFGGPTSQCRKVDQPFVDHISDTALVDEALSILRCHKRRIQPIPEDASSITALMKRFRVWDGLNALRYTVGRPTWPTADTSLVACIKDFISTPLPSRALSQTNLERSERLHYKMWDFWQRERVVREERLETAGLSSETLSRYMKIQSAGVADEYVAGRDQELDRHRAAIQQKRESPRMTFDILRKC